MWIGFSCHFLNCNADDVNNFTVTVGAGGYRGKRCRRVLALFRNEDRAERTMAGFLITWNSHRHHML
jgi:hypothetical protein